MTLVDAPVGEASLTMATLRIEVVWVCVCVVVVVVVVVVVFGGVVDFRL